MQNDRIIYICLMLQISEIIELIENDLQRLQFPQQPAGLYTPVSYMLSIGGKRIRPALCLMASNLYADEITPYMHTALAMEVFHNFTLMHDDIMDAAPLRRGKQSVHEKWNTNTAILSGDVMLVKAYELLNKTKTDHFTEILNIFNQTAIQVCEGQQLDVDFEKSETVSVDAYLDMITKKTAVLLGCSLFCGAAAAGATIDDAELLYQTGIAAGISFQIMDDLLDVFGDAAAVGKKTGGDILQHKKTFLYVSTFAVADTADRNALISFYTDKYAGDAKITGVLNLFEKYNVKEIAAKEMDKYFQKAISLVQKLSITERRKDILLQFLNSVYHRKF